MLFVSRKLKDVKPSWSNVSVSHCESKQFIAFGLRENENTHHTKAPLRTWWIFSSPSAWNVFIKGRERQRIVDWNASVTADRVEEAFELCEW
jgi:hypothetical protein